MDRRKSQRVIFGAAGVALGLLAATGCRTGPTPTTMNSAMFMPPTGGGNGESPLTINQPMGPVTNDTPPPGRSETSIPRAVVIAPPSTLPDIKPIPRLDAGPSDPVDPHQAGVRSDPPATATDPAQPAAAHIDPAPGPSGSTASTSSLVPSPGSGVYMSVGGVVARVGSTPIFTDTVLNRLDKEFAARSRELTPEEFKMFAREEIDRQVMELIQDEILFVTSDKALSEEDHKLARMIAEKDRHDLVLKSTGSVAMARKKSVDDGTDLDHECQENYRHIIIGLYQERMIDPLIQVSADDLRDFYRQNVDKLYTEKEKISFRVIQIRPEVTGGDNPAATALEKIRGLREKAVRGDDFATLASNVNDDAYLKSNGGAVGWMDRGSFHIAAVDQAVWKLEPGQVTDIIADADGNLYIARVEEKKVGRVRPFDDQAVQDEISNRLKKQQEAVQMSRLQREAREEQIVSTSDAQVDLALEMAMQKYGRK